MKFVQYLILPSLIFNKTEFNLEPICHVGFQEWLVGEKVNEKKIKFVTYCWLVSKKLNDFVQKSKYPWQRLPSQEEYCLILSFNMIWVVNIWGLYFTCCECFTLNPHISGLHKLRQSTSCIVLNTKLTSSFWKLNCSFLNVCFFLPKAQLNKTNCLKILCLWKETWVRSRDQSKTVLLVKDDQLSYGYTYILWVVVNFIL